MTIMTKATCLPASERNPICATALLNDETELSAKGLRSESLPEKSRKQSITFLPFTSRSDP